ncbi:MAG TPA: GGDEF domain-containing protein [Acidimicrobiales bacterium]|nr:GGDEF domain-containing protein [Acidimicrobiales bacterium]
MSTTAAHGPRHEFLAPRTVGRLGGGLFVITAAVMVPLVVLDPAGDGRVDSLVAVGAVSLVTGMAAWFLPWNRWPRWATLLLAPLACGLITVGNVVNPDPSLYSVYLLVVFAWIGIAHPPGTSLRLFFLVVVTYMAPIVFNDELRDDAIRSVAVVTPVCLLVAEVLSRVVDRLRQVETLNAKRLHDLESLVDATIRLSRSADPRHTSNLVAELAVHLLGATSSLVLLASREGTLQPAGAFNWGLGADTAPELEEGAARALSTGEITRKADGSLGFIPLISAAGPQGLVVVTSTGGVTQLLDSFTSGLARTFATQATVAFERVRATQSLVDASFRDPLTGVGNRRRADTALQSLSPGDAVAIVDLDHFKDVNDRWGHPVGDQVLTRLASLLQDSVRGGDVVSRYGGEEFMVLLKGVGDKCKPALERISEEWQAIRLGTTFSAGVAVNRSGESAAATVARADQALYRAKEGGRNLVVLAPGPEAALEPA